MGSTILTERTDLQDVAGYLLKQHAFLFDVETYGPDRGNPSKAPVSWLSIASNGIGIVIPMGHPNGEMLTKATRKKNPLTKKFDMIPATFSAPPKQLNPGTVFEILEPLFMHPTIRKSAFNATFDNVAVAKYYDDTPPAPPYDDPIVQQWLLNENMISLGLKDLTTRYYQHTYDKEHVGRQVEIHPFSKVARYAYLDAKYPWLMQEKHFLPMIESEGLRDIYDLEMQVLEVLLSMRMTGAMVDVDMLHTLRTELSAQVVDLEGAIYKAAGQKFNLNSPPQKQKILFGSKDEGGQGLKPLKETKGGAPSTDATTLEAYPKNPVCASMLEYQEVNKILSTYVNGYLGVEGDPSKPCIIYDGRIYADLVQYGTVTGRFSCLSGDTQLITNRGTFTIADYEPLEGDLIRTHRDRWMPIARKFYQGVRDVYRVTLINGFSLECTQDHLLLTAGGWQELGNLNPNDKVLVDDRFSSPDAPSRVRGEGVGDLSLGGEADDEGDRSHLRLHLSDGGPNARTLHGFRGASAGEGSTVLTRQGWKSEPYVVEVRKQAPQLSWGNPDSGRLPSTEGWGPVRPVASSSYGGRSGTGQASKSHGSAPHQRQEDRQLSGQLGAGDTVGAREVAWDEVAIREIAFVASMGVWDIEVDGDHSFVTQGFIVHNCRNPNLQNIPRPGTDLGTKVRGLFIAGPGKKLVVADYGQIELVVLAHYSRAKALVDGFNNGVDAHTMTAAKVYKVDISEVTKPMRQTAKGLAFAVTYGAGPDKVAAMANISVKDAKKFLQIHEQEFPEIYRFKEKVLASARSRRPAHLRTLMGRKRRIPALFARDGGSRGMAERQAVNSLIQGSAADLIKLAMIRLHKALPEDSKLILSIHDELVVECPEDKAEEVAAIMREAMLGEGISKWLSVPMTISMMICDVWAEAKD